MKAFALLLIALSTSAQAGGGLFERNQLETRDEARQRQSAENYEAYNNRRGQLPPTYQGTFGGTERGVERPGYNRQFDPYQREYR